jgi:hypothetical protein
MREHPSNQRGFSSSHPPKAKKRHMGAFYFWRRVWDGIAPTAYQSHIGGVNCGVVLPKRRDGSNVPKLITTKKYFLNSFFVTSGTHHMTSTIFGSAAHPQAGLHGTVNDHDCIT